MHRSVNRVFLIVIQILIILVFSGCSKDSNFNQNTTPTTAITEQNKTINSGLNANTDVLAETTLLSNADNLLTTITEGRPHYPQNSIVFSPLGRGVAYIADMGDNQMVVHNGKPGPTHTGISRLIISPDGKRLSYRCTLINKEQMISDGIAGQVYDNVRDQLYSPDSRHLATLATIGDRAIIANDGVQIDEGTLFNGLYFSSDSSRLFYTSPPQGGKPARIVIYNLKTKTKVVKEFLDTPITVNKKTDRIALPVKDGEGQRVVVFSVYSPENTIKSAMYDVVSHMTLGDDGKSLAFIGDKGPKRYLVLNGSEKQLPEGMAVTAPPVIRPDLKGAGVLLSTAVRFDRRFVLFQTMVAESTHNKQYDDAAELVYSSANAFPAYAAKDGDKWFAVINGKEGPPFDMVVTPMFSPDGKKLVYRARKGEKRFIVIADVRGGEHRPHAEVDMVFPTVFTNDGKSVAYGIKDGNKLVWKAEKL